MTQIFNKFDHKRIRRTLRNRPTVAENKLWYFLKSQQLGMKFRRQYGIGQYIVDFYSPELRLVIEVDGDSHETKEAISNDVNRQKDIEVLGIKVIRFTNDEVLKNMEGVLGVIRDAIKPRNLPLPLLR